MKEENNRRSFLKNLGVGGLAAVALPGSLLSTPAVAEASNAKREEDKKSNASTVKKRSRQYNAPYTNEYLNRVAFPIGGMGAGMFCLEGTGAISNMSIRHKPELFHEPNAFAAIAVKGVEKGAKVIEGPVPEWKIFGQRGSGNGGHGATYGLPRFSNVEFVARFPFASLSFKDSDMPLEVQMTGWSPFTPGDEDNSSLPVAGFEYTFKNKGSKAVEAVFSYNTRNFVVQHDNGKASIGKIQNGFVLSQAGNKERPQGKADFAIFTDDAETVVDHCWFRGGWFDPLTMVWNTIKEGNVKSTEPVDRDAPGASLFVPFSLNPGQEKTVKVMMSWYVPDSDLRFGDRFEGAGSCMTAADLGIDNTKSSNSPTYKPWYSSKFNNVHEVANFWRSNYSELHKKSTAFKDAFYASTLPAEVTEAVAANLTILKSSTVMRQYDGRLWAWEGCSDDWGCCHGSCTHVWNYAQAVPHLFPRMERSLRHTEFCENQNGDGHQAFRANLPISPLKHDFHAAADGQLGGIMKVYRDWRISGDSNWLKKMYPMVKTSMDYSIRTWDPKEKGVVEEPHHNTYDIEFWGPNGMITSFYLGALNATAEMGKFLKQDVKKYSKLYEKGKGYMEDKLYNGEYFIQDIQWTGLNAPDPVQAQSFHTQYTEEAKEVLKKEGPKYQYGTGCLSDGVLGSWMARMSGLEEPVNAQKTKSHLMAVHKYNLKDDLSDHVNPQRPTYAMGNEGGLLLCSWPKGGMLSLPFVYSNEVWTGIEYQVASHLMLHGQVKEGLDIVQACRDRYDGRIRNPFNEYECGSWYARAMSSYGMLQGLTGVRYDAVDQTLYIDSKVGDFTSFVSTENGFGTVTLKDGKPTLSVAHGKIPVKKVLVSGKKTKLS
ncbi:GH116 family glycosyl hydrolase [Rufibacter roseus]|uniref:GH116 family glycosyl hydrolase n=1 Tax=Rufibacter roseus TaxID=1567108 RepID=A0ABW2DLM5_9BACT|nr:GH116 family glycosyl hydrolase [Rufibacter roseus]